MLAESGARERRSSDTTRAVDRARPEPVSDQKRHAKREETTRIVGNQAAHTACIQLGDQFDEWQHQERHGDRDYGVGQGE